MSVVLVNISSADHSPLQLKFKVRETSIAKKWFEELRRKLLVTEPFGEPAAIFKGFSAAGRTVEQCAEELFAACDCIHSHNGQFLPKNYRHLEINGETLQVLHKSYEIMRGEVIASTDYMRSAPESVQQAVEVLNERIHEIEHLIYNKSPIGGVIKVILKDGTRTPMEPEDQRHFSMERSFAALTLRYCVTGKTYVETFYEKDELVGEHNIRPLNQYNGEFDITFRESRYWASEEFQAPFHRWLRERGKDPEDTSLSLGWLTVADLVYEGPLAQWDKQRICREVGLRPVLQSVECVL